MKKYVYKPYDPLFVELFQKEKERILGHVRNIAAIEHVGSTAVPGLGGKGIIDLAIGVDKSSFEAVSKELIGLGYEFRVNGSTEERLFFRIDLPDPKEKVRRYHVHLLVHQSLVWKELVGFRNHLIAHPSVLEQYAEMKKLAASSADGDGEAYRKLKDPFIQQALKSLKI
ncbi:MAG: GrpB family protein [Verrucomicrobia bacterium]|nr:GrpB family protein [Verrucomicrobiota bacterium]